MPSDPYAGRRARTDSSGRRGGHRAATAAVLSLLLALAGVVTLPPPPAPAAVQKAFASVFNTEDNGAISIVGNSQMSCQASASGCTAARNRSGSGAALNNNNYVMAFSDVDDVAATTNSTSADVALPAGSTVRYARLIWSGRLDAGASGVAASGAAGVAKLRSPTQFAYSTVTATTLTTPNIGSHPYQASLDVTSTVAAGGNGTYFFADQSGATGSDVYAGWALVIAYSNSNLPLRDLTVFEGFADISSTAGNSSVSTTVSGFLTPASGAVNATVGVGAWEGDLGSTGDALSFNGTTLSDATRPADNFFDSSISSFGVANPAKNPAYPNNLGVDFGRISANGVLGNGASSATVNVSSVGETIYLGLLTTEIDLYTPSFAGISKSVTDLDGNSPAQVGDTLEYRLSFVNSGDDTASAVRVRDTLPAGISYVPGSIVVATGANASVVPKTDAAGDDVAEYDDAGRLVRVRLGTGADQSSGGTVAPAGTSAVTFHATVDAAAAGTTVTNGAFLDYRAQTLNRDYTFDTNVVDTTVSGLADLSVTQTGAPTSVAAGNAVTYSVTVANLGPDTASDVVTTDTLPAGSTFSTLTLPAGTTCSVLGQVVTCTTATLASGASVTIPITATVGPGTAAGSVVNTASVASDTSDPTASNNTATTTTTVTRDADLALTKTGPSSVAAGSQPTYTLTVTNAGPSTAAGTSVTDTLPTGLTRVSTTPSQGTCSAAGQTITCALGTLAPGSTATVAVKVTVAASFTGASLTNTASVSATTPDPASANNTASKTSTVTQNADIAVTKTVAPTTATAGDVVTYTLDVTNLAGASDARGVVLADALPAGLTLLSAMPTQGTCTTTSPLSCALGLITPGSSTQVTVSARVASTTSAGTVTNTASATTTTAESVTANDSSSVNLAVVTRADLSLTKTADPDPVQLGNTLTYTLAAANNGPSQARGVTVTDPLPAGVTFLSAGPGCAAASGTVTCTVGTLEAGGTATRTITVGTPQAAPAGTVTNTATVTATTTDPATADNTATVVSTTRASADLTLSKTTSPSPVVPGRDLTYTLTVGNDGPSTASGVRVSDTLPSGVGYRSSSIAGGGSCSRTGQDLSCPVGTLPAGSSAVVTVVGHLDADLTATSTSNTAVVDDTGPTDPTTSNNSATSTTAVSASADLGVTLATTSPTVRAGEVASYRVVATNAGPSTAGGTVVTVALPAGLQPVAGSLPAGCTVTGQTLSCAVGTLAADDPTTLDFSARVLPGTPAGTLSTTASVGSTTADPSPGDNSATTPLTVATAADLAAAVSVAPAVLVAGRTATYTLTVDNLGPSDATDLTLTGTLPDELTVVSAGPSAGSCTVTGRQVSCTLARLSPGTQLGVALLVRLDPGATTSVTNGFTVTSATADPVADNNAAATTNEVGQSADLRLTKTAGPDPVPAGGTLRYTLHADSLGPSTARAVVLDDTLPAGVQLAGDGVDAPPGVTCTTDLPANRVTCALGDLAFAASVSVTVDAIVPATTDADTTLENSASLTSPTPTDDPGARTDTVTSTVTTSADLSITKTGIQESPTAGGPTTYVVTVVNLGPSVARGAHVVDSLSDDLSFVDADDPLGACTPAAGAPGQGDTAGSRVRCTLGDLAPGENVRVELHADVDPAAAGGLVRDTATVGSDTPDPSSTDDSATVEQPVTGLNDLELTKTGPATVTPGEAVRWTLTASNLGPSLASGVEVRDAVPAAVTGLDVEAPAGVSCTGGHALHCTVAELAVGAGHAVTVVVTGTLAADFAEPGLTNTATVSTTTPDPAEENDRSTTRASVTPRADLSVSKSGPATVTAGRSITWMLTAHNAGPGRARDVVVTDALPAGVEQIAPGPPGDGVSCAVAARTVRCVISALDAGQDRRVPVRGVVAPGYPAATLTNLASISSTAVDPDHTDDTSAAVTTTVLRRADVSVTKTVDAASVAVGAPVTYHVRVASAGPSDATGVVVQERWPAGVSFVWAGTATGSYDPATRRWTVGTLAPGQTAVLDLVGTVSDRGGLRNQVALRTHQGFGDPTAGNDTAGVTLTRAPAPARSASAAPGSRGLPDTGGPGLWLLVLGGLGVSSGAVLLTGRRRRRTTRR